MRFFRELQILHSVSWLGLSLLYFRCANIIGVFYPLLAGNTDDRADSFATLLIISFRFGAGRQQSAEGMRSWEYSHSDDQKDFLI